MLMDIQPSEPYVDCVKAYVPWESLCCGPTPRAQKLSVSIGVYHSRFTSMVPDNIGKNFVQTHCRSVANELVDFR
jgi:hypothetical protein